MTINQVMAAFIRGESKVSGSVSTDGRSLYSYGVKVAEKSLDNPHARVTTRKYSVTTSKHTNAAARFLVQGFYTVTREDF